MWGHLENKQLYKSVIIYVYYGVKVERISKNSVHFCALYDNMTFYDIFYMTWYLQTIMLIFRRGFISNLIYGDS